MRGGRQTNANTRNHSLAELINSVSTANGTARPTGPTLIVFCFSGSVGPVHHWKMKQVPHNVSHGLSAPKMQRDGTPRYTEGSAPHRCITEPIRLKSTRDSTHRWMKEGVQVINYGR
jgi:hypothetical protein